MRKRGGIESVARSMKLEVLKMCSSVGCFVLLYMHTRFLN